MAASPSSIASAARCFHAASTSAAGRTPSSSRRLSSTSRHSALPARSSTSGPARRCRRHLGQISSSRSGSRASVAVAMAITAASALSASSGQVRMISPAMSAHCRLAAVRHSGAPVLRQLLPARHGDLRRLPAPLGIGISLGQERAEGRGIVQPPGIVEHEGEHVPGLVDGIEVFLRRQRQRLAHAGDRPCRVRRRRVASAASASAALPAASACFFSACFCCIDASDTRTASIADSNEAATAPASSGSDLPSCSSSTRASCA